MTESRAQTLAATPVLSRPRLGFLGTGWIGRHRLEAIAASELADVIAVADADLDAALVSAAAVGTAPRVLPALESLLELDLDGLVIATPSALHAEQALAAIDRGLAVFCQKPLGRSGDETERVVRAARQRNVLLGVDLSYRCTTAMRAIRDQIARGYVGQVFAADLVFHNAYGPGKEWFYDRSRSGGGCVIDLGIHLVDLALWVLDWSPVVSATSRLYSRGEPLAGFAAGVEDYAEARLDLANQTTVRLACSWKLSAGQDAVIEAVFHGTTGGLAMRNVNGSFYDFRAERYVGSQREVICQPPDAWGGRAAVAWARQLASGSGYDPEVERVVDVARTLDAIYASAEVA